ncbi:MAG TPA: PQQ-binding-like beta-propeller repeat protein [Pirellulales bacterium]|jgi:outer membrane protein assembly factor BamB|nr:PQQ-binding-like beta-propeller repeat protein [Pirellulales bacterium]
MTSPSGLGGPPTEEFDIGRLVFVGFNSRIAALNRENGEVVWQWVSPKGSGIPVLLLDGDRLMVSVQGYTYCLDPATGNQLWHNPLKGMGIGVPCLASARGNTTPQLYAVLAEYEMQQQEAAAHTAQT